MGTTQPPEPVIAVKGTWGPPVQLMSRFRRSWSGAVGQDAAAAGVLLLGEDDEEEDEEDSDFFSVELDVAFSVDFSPDFSVEVDDELSAPASDFATALPAAARLSVR